MVVLAALALGGIGVGPSWPTTADWWLAQVIVGPPAAAAADGNVTLAHPSWRVDVLEMTVSKVVLFYSADDVISSPRSGLA